MPTETFQLPTGILIVVAASVAERNFSDATEILIVDAAPVADQNFSAADGNFNRCSRARCRPKLFRR
ncbi:MAG: hypothetical protein IKD80_03130 [Selenomonadaceae bacterium]|nr:hypothetical protein [Selenomonadaceae bacterium]